nr:ribonuclease H [uncultured Blautia sp.]
MAPDYLVYTDGGCAFNPGGPGGCAAVILNRKTGERTELSESYQCTTNNRMEVMAVIIAMEKIPEKSVVLVYSDSQYVIKTMEGYFRKKKNVDLWQRMDQVCRGKKIEWRWVKGHNGNPENECCDRLCTQAMQRIKKKEDAGYQKIDGFGKMFCQQREQKETAMTIPIELPPFFVAEFFSPCTKSKYCEIYQVREPCAESILDFYRYNKSSFGDYLELKSSGIDFWSRKSEEKLLEYLQERGMDKDTILLLKDTIVKYLPDEKDQLFCLRWYMRGLLLKDCIRKTWVTKEVSENCR